MSTIRSLAIRAGLVRGTGCLRVETPDPNDWEVERLVGSSGPLPESHDFRSAKWWTTLTQPNNDCVPHALVQGVMGMRALAGIHDGTPSRRFIYYEARRVHGTNLRADVGCHIPSAIKAAREYGLPHESVCPITWPIDKRPPLSAYREGYDTSEPGDVDAYARCRSLTDVKRALAANCPVLFGINLATGDWAKKGPEEIVPKKNPGRKQELHGLVLFGYRPGAYLALNSWGPGFRDDGFVWIPDELMDGAFDMYTIKLVL